MLTPEIKVEIERVKSVWSKAKFNDVNPVMAAEIVKASAFLYQKLEAIFAEEPKKPNTGKR